MFTCAEVVLAAEVLLLQRHYSLQQLKHSGAATARLKGGSLARATASVALLLQR